MDDARQQGDNHLRLIKATITHTFPHVKESEQVRENGFRFAPRAEQPKHRVRLSRKLQYRVLRFGIAVGAQLHAGLGVGVRWLANVGKNTRSNLLQKVVALSFKPLVYLGGAITKFVVFCGERACLLLQRKD